MPDYKIAIYPNPTSDILNIQTDAKINAVSVVDLTGRKQAVRFENNRVDVRNLPAGTYILNVETENGISTEKFVRK
nr:T9SS type A sorting domain-containing protein [Chryseobacterium tagetis]